MPYQPDVTYPAPDFAFDFSRSINPIIGGGTTTVSTSANGWYFNSAGLLVQNSANNPRLDYTLGSSVFRGLLVEEARTIDTVWSRDLSNAAWIKTSCTATKDAQGIDGVANSCTTLTATEGNATCLQTLTAAATNRTFAPYIRRVTGSGTIQYTQDGGATWTTISTASNVWSRASDLVVSRLNPQFGFRIVTSGDAIAVDFVNLDPGTFSTSPINTQGVSVTRAADNISIPLGAWFNQTRGVVFAEYVAGIGSRAISSVVCAINDGTNNERYAMYTTPSQNAVIITDGGVLQANLVNGSVTAGNTYRGAFAYQAANCAFSDQGLANVTNGTATLPTPNSMQIGSQNNALYLDGWVRKVAVWSRNNLSETYAFLRDLSGSGY